MIFKKNQQLFFKVNHVNCLSTHLHMMLLLTLRKQFSSEYVMMVFGLFS